MLFHEVLEGVFLKLCTQGSRAIGIGQQACIPVLCPIHFVRFNLQVLVVVCIFRLLWPGCSETGRGELQLQNSAAAVIDRKGRAEAAEFCSCSGTGRAGCSCSETGKGVCSCTETGRESCSCRILQLQRDGKGGLQLQ